MTASTSPTSACDPVRVNLGRLVRSAIAAQVRDDDPESRPRQRRDLVPPESARVGEAVEQHDRPTLAGHLVMDAPRRRLQSACCGIVPLAGDRCRSKVTDRLAWLLLTGVVDDNHGTWPVLMTPLDVLPSNLARSRLGLREPTTIVAALRSRATATIVRSRCCLSERRLPDSDHGESGGCGVGRLVAAAGL